MAGKRGKYNTVAGGMTHAEIGAVLGLTGQRVQQIEAAAIKKIRAAFPELAVINDGDDENTVEQGSYHIWTEGVKVWEEPWSSV